jgi:hypothetical protein
VSPHSYTIFGKYRAKRREKTEVVASTEYLLFSPYNREIYNPPHEGA